MQTCVVIAFNLQIDYVKAFNSLGSLSMRELNSIETQNVAGGFEPAFVLSILAGATGCSQSNTVTYSALWGGFVFGLAGLPYFIVGAAFTAPIGFLLGAVDGFIGYKIGSLFYNGPQQPQTVYVVMPPQQN